MFLVGYLASLSFLNTLSDNIYLLNSILCTLPINNLGSYVFLNQTTSQDNLDSLKQSSEDGEEEDHRK